MDKFFIIFIPIVAIISLTIAILLFVLFIQRRRQRALLMLAIAQEEADRRRRKRKKAGLRRWEIDFACPEALVSDISSTSSAVQMFSLKAHPEQYSTAVQALRAKGLLAAPSSGPSPPLLPAGKDVSVPKPLLLKDVENAPSSELTSDVLCDIADDLPLQMVSVPETMETCVICLDDITTGARVRSLPCLHVYHSQCIRVWLRRKNACPCCCVKVIKKRRKRERIIEEAQLGVVRETNLIESLPPTSSPQQRLGDDNLPADDLMPIVAERRGDRGEDTTLEFLEPRSKSMSYCDDRSRVPDLNLRQSVMRSTSLLDPLDPDEGSGVLASEASSHIEEPCAAELLEHVRKALRGESSIISLNEDESKSELDDDSFRPAIGVRRHVDLELGRRAGVLAADVKHD